jgi:hypothetical protein
MSEPQTFSRSPRLRKPLPHYELEIPGPGAESKPESWLPALMQAILPVALMGLVMVLIARVTNQSGTFMLMMIPMMAVGGLVSLITFAQQRQRNQRNAEKRQTLYQARLAAIRDELQKKRVEQQELMAENDPSPRACYEERLKLNATEPHRHVWTRTPEDADFPASP